jgi:hypothetical protein
MTIQSVHTRHVLDSRGNPTIEVTSASTVRRSPASLNQRAGCVQQRHLFIVIKARAGGNNLTDNGFGACALVRRRTHASTGHSRRRSTQSWSQHCKHETTSCPLQPI